MKVYEVPWLNCGTSSRYPRPRYQDIFYRIIGPLVIIIVNTFFTPQTIYNILEQETKYYN